MQRLAAQPDTPRTRTVLLEIILLYSKSVFDTELEPRKPQHIDIVFYCSFGRRADEISAMSLAVLHNACLENKDQEAGVRFSSVKADFSFHVGQGLIEWNRFGPRRMLDELRIDDVVGEVLTVHEAFSTATNDK